jgi:CheY-like chemotaxis protein
MGAALEALAGLHILVVEDDDGARVILSDLFRYFGAHVTAAKNAGEGLARLRRIVPDVVVVDMRLGDHLASWLLRKARKIPCEAPFVAVTAYDFDERIVLAQGFAALVRKPLHAHRLVETVMTAARRR